MSYKLRFHELALAEWKKLDGSVREPLKKKLVERLDNPRIPAAALSGMADCYTLPRHNLPIYPSSGGRAAALQIACVERPHGAICALHRIPPDAAKSSNRDEARYTRSS